MSAAAVLEQRLEVVIVDLPIQLGSIYTLKSRNGWTWLAKRGKHLYVDLLAAADFWELSRRQHVAVRLRARAMLLAEINRRQNEGVAPRCGDAA